MLQSRLIPVLLLKGEGLYKTVRFKDPNYIGDPRNAVKIFNEKEVDEICLLDITATNEKRPPNFTLIEEITSEAFMPLSYGGGVNSIEDIKRLFSLGVEKVIINSVLYEKPELITAAAKIFGEQSIIASIDVKKDIFGKYHLYSHAGKKKQKSDLFTFVQRVSDLGVGEIILNSIDRDGTMQGMDIKLIREVANSISIPLVAAGGIGTFEDIQLVLRETDVAALGIGSFFVYHGKQRGILITYPNQDQIERLNQ